MAALAWVLPAAAAAAGGETVILQLQILEGENAVFAASGRALKPIAVRVTNEIGAPVAGVAVSFRLPEEGVTGIFQNGLRTDMVLSGADGKAVSPNIAWGPLAGPARLRVTAALDEARAGALVPVYVSANNVVAAGAAIAPQRFDSTPAPKLRKKRGWIRWVVATVAAGGGAGIAMALAKKPGAATSAAGPAISVGQPTITVGGKLP